MATTLLAILAFPLHVTPSIAQADGHIAIGEGRNWTLMHPPRYCKRVQVIRHYVADWVDECSDKYKDSDTINGRFLGPLISNYYDGSVSK